MMRGLGLLSWMSGILAVIWILLEVPGRELFPHRVREATHGVAAVGALPLGFRLKLGIFSGKFLPAGLHAVEASYVSASALCLFRAATVRVVSSSRMPLAKPSVFFLKICLTVQFGLIQISNDAKIFGSPAAGNTLCFFSDAGFHC